MSRSFNEQGAQRLFFTLVPLPQAHCSSCGRDPRWLYDDHNQYIVGRDETQGLDERGHCAECAARRKSWAHTKHMRGRK